jgi:hypothetical protein
MGGMSEVLPLLRCGGDGSPMLFMYGGVGVLRQGVLVTEVADLPRSTIFHGREFVAGFDCPAGALVSHTALLLAYFYLRWIN